MTLPPCSPIADSGLMSARVPMSLAHALPVSNTLPVAASRSSQFLPYVLGLTTDESV